MGNRQGSTATSAVASVGCDKDELSVYEDDVSRSGCHVSRATCHSCGLDIVATCVNTACT